MTGDLADWPATLRRAFCTLLFASLLTGLAASRAAAEFARYEIDPEHFSVGFLTHHIGYANLLGTFLRGGGSFQFDEAGRAVKDIEVTIEAESVFTNHAKRDDHLRSAEFLDADEHPEIRFVGTDARATGDNTGVVTGDLTLLGVTKPIRLDITLNKIGPYPFGDGPPYVVGISARSKIKRSDFGMTYAVENGWVGDEVELIIEFEAIRQ